MFTQPTYQQSRSLPYPYQVSSDGLGEVGGLFSSFKKVVKKAAPVALPVLGAVAAPFTGGASLVVAGVGSQLIRAKAEKNAIKGAEDKQRKMIAQANANAQAMGLDPYAASYALTTGGSNLVPVTDPQTGQLTYVSQDPSLFEEYKTPIMIGGAILAGGLIIYYVVK